MHRVVVASSVLAALLSAAACTGHVSFDLPPPPPTSPTTSSTLAIDYSTVVLAGVPGQPTSTTIPNIPGNAHLAGTVAGPDGAVGGATVRAERLVDDQSLAFDVRTNTDGTWRLDNLQGGRWRVRAWRAPDLAGTGTSVFYLGAAETRTVAISLARQQGTVVQAVVAPDPPPVGQPANVAVVVATRVVDDQGVVHDLARPATQVELVSSGDWRLLSPNPVVTSTSGQASWNVVCGAAGSQGLAVVVDAQPYQLGLADCAPPPTTTTGSSTTELPGATSTTRPRRATTTTP